MYKHETTNPDPDKVDFDCTVCNTPQKNIITNFRLDLFTKEKLCIFANDLFTHSICLDCLIKEVRKWLALQHPTTKKRPGPTG